MITEFNKHKIYKHKNMVDVAFLVTGIENGFNNNVMLRGHWMRDTGMDKMHQISADIISVNLDDVTNWNLVNEEGNRNE